MDDYTHSNRRLAQQQHEIVARLCHHVNRESSSCLMCCAQFVPRILSLPSLAGTETRARSAAAAVALNGENGPIKSEAVEDA